jgi:chromosome segregation ATPase
MEIDGNVFTRLEEKIELIVQRVTILKNENEALRQKLAEVASARTELESHEKERINILQAENEKLKLQLTETSSLQERLEAKEKNLAEVNELLAAYDAERAEIRSRVESLVAKLEMSRG